MNLQQSSHMSNQIKKHTELKQELNEINQIILTFRNQLLDENITQTHQL